MSVVDTLVFGLAFIVGSAVCASLELAVRQPTWTFDVFAEEIPDVRIFGTQKPTGRIRLVCKGDWIIGWLDGRRIAPIYDSEHHSIFFKYMPEGVSVSVKDDNPVTISLGLFTLLPEDTPHIHEYKIPRRTHETAHPAYSWLNGLTGGYWGQH